jgi:hypothetical protein
MPYYIVEEKGVKQREYDGFRTKAHARAFAKRNDYTNYGLAYFEYIGQSRSYKKPKRFYCLLCHRACKHDPCRKCGRRVLTREQMSAERVEDRRPGQ